MSNREDSDMDDDFSDLYKEYTGPPRSNNTSDTAKANKRSHAGSDDEEEGFRDPNAVPTDFTSREAKVWEAKSKATERNWKKRKEEEMICKICGESGHFTQGCPSTLGANRKSQDFFERVPARDPQVKALFTEKVISRIEQDIGCKIKMEEKFLIVSGKDRLILAKGVDAVHKIKNEGDRSPDGRSPVNSSRLARSDSQRSNPSPRNYNQRFSSRQDKMIEDLHKFPRGSPQASYGSDRSRSPAAYTATAPPQHNDRRRAVAQRNKGDMQSHTLEDLYLEYKRDAMEITKIRDKEEDEENNRHRQAVREMREDYMKRFSMLRATHARQWEEFRMRHPHMPPPASSGFGGGYKQPPPEYENNANANAAVYGGGNMGMDSRVRYPDIDNYPPPRSHDGYGEFQRQRHHQDYGKPSYNNRY